MIINHLNNLFISILISIAFGLIYVSVQANTIAQSVKTAFGVNTAISGIVIAILAGAISGFFLGQFLYSLFGNQIPANGVLMNVIFVVVSIAILIAVACFLKDTIVIFATSFIGYYCFIRGISLFAGSFPDEFTVIDLVNNEEFEQLKLILTWQVYVYLGAIALTTILSIVIQCIFNKKKDDDEFPKGSKLMKASD